VLLDTYVSNLCLDRGERRRFFLLDRPLQWIKYLSTSDATEAGLALHRALDLIKTGIGIGVHRSLNRLPGTPLREAVAAVARAEIRGYRPPSYQGAVTFVRANRRLPNLCDPTHVWERAVAGGLRLATLDGGHFDIVAWPAVQELADLLDAHLSGRAAVPDDADQAPTPMVSERRGVSGPPVA
jgi:thioesterase domain-containing protein